ncbi:MAG: acetylornithine transaminase [Burkholderiaceae bacterium]|nr:acetylornithine transaminase [Burkholderiaceae bacterium]
MKIDHYETSALMNIAARPAQVFVAGRGSWLVDHRGKRHLDFVQGWAVNALGHCPPEVTQALAAQAQRLLNPSPGLFNDQAIALATKLAQRSGLPRVFLASSGAEANEGAIKLARRWGRTHRAGAHEVITFADAFHGRTLATMSASGKAGWDRLFEPKVPGFPRARLNDVALVEALIGPQTVAVMLEPVQGEAGVIPASHAFLRDLRALCDRHDLLLILDEVQTGIGRTGTMFAFEQSGVAPDVLTLGKGLGGGVPLSALLCNPRADCFEPGDQGGTYCGNPLMAAVGCAVLDAVSQPAFLAQVRERAGQMQQVLQRHARRVDGQVRAAGLLQALVLPWPPAARVAGAARELAPDGLLVNAARPDVLRLMPALNVLPEEIAQMDRLLGQALDAVRP